MQLEDFYDYKNKLMEDILTNETLVHLINEDIKMEDAYKLAYDQVFPAEFVPVTIHDGSTFVCFDVDVQSAGRASTKTFLYPVLYVWVFVHRHRLRLPDGGGVRTDKICSEICKAINGSRYYGLGELNFDSCKRFAPVTDYNGKCMVFKAKEFNRIHDPKKPVPANRKDN